MQRLASQLILCFAPVSTINKVVCFSMTIQAENRAIKEQRAETFRLQMKNSRKSSDRRKTKKFECSGQNTDRDIQE